MKTFIEKIKSIFKQKPRLIVGLVIVLALSLPFVINQVLKQQDLRQHASTAPAISFNFSPATKTVSVGQTFDVDFVMNAGTNDIGSLMFTLTYDSTILSQEILAQPTDLKKVSQKDQGNDHTIIMTSTASTPTTGNGLKVISFKFTALKETSSTPVTIEPNSVKATATGSYDIFVPITGQIAGSYTITAQDVSPSLTVIPTDGTANCDNITGREPGCHCAQSSQCASNFCLQPPTGANPTGEAGMCILQPTPTPTIQPTPTPTIQPTPTAPLTTNETVIEGLILLPGISDIGGNKDPKHTSRKIYYQIFDNQNKKVYENSQAITFTTTPPMGGNPGFYARFSTTTLLPTDSYTAKVRIDNALWKKLPIIISVKNHEINTIGSTTLITGDFGNTNSLDVSDYTLLVACYQENPSCTANDKLLTDLNDDGTVDNADLNILQRGFAIRNGD